MVSEWRMTSRPHASMVSLFFPFAQATTSAALEASDLSGELPVVPALRFFEFGQPLSHHRYGGVREPGCWKYVVL